MKAAWTGGQYSVYRALLGASVLGVSVAPLLRGPGPSSLEGVCLALSALAACFLAGGKWDRSAALLLAGLSVLRVWSDPRDGIGEAVLWGALFFAHAAQTTAPYGSWAAKGRLDPGGQWRPSSIVTPLLWVLLAGYYALLGASGGRGFLGGADPAGRFSSNNLRSEFSQDGAASLPAEVFSALGFGVSIVEWLFVPLCFWARARPGAWAVTLVLHAALWVSMHSTGVGPALLLLHVATFNPAWIKARRVARPERLYYDGNCGLCHGFVRFVLAEDQAAEPIRFSPLFSETFQGRVSTEQAAKLADSVVLQSADGRLLQKSSAVIRVLSALGGLWGIGAFGMRLIPRPLRDLAYDGIAAVRHRLFTRPEAACPLLPARLQGRFDP